MLCLGRLEGRHSLKVLKVAIGGEAVMLFRLLYFMCETIPRDYRSIQSLGLTCGLKHVAQSKRADSVSELLDALHFESPARG